MYILNNVEHLNTDQIDNKAQKVCITQKPKFKDHKIFKKQINLKKKQMI